MATSNPPPDPPDGISSSSTKRVTGVAGIMMAAILASRLLGLVRESVIAHQFGQNRITDVYNAAFTIPDLLFFLIAGGAFSGAFIPVFSEYIAKGKEKEAWRIFSAIATMVLMVVTVFIVAGEIFTVPLTALTSGFINVDGGVPVPSGVGGIGLIWYLIKAGFAYMLDPASTPEKIRQTAELTRILLPGQICFFLGGLMMGALQTKGNPWGQATGPLIYNLCIILGGVLLKPVAGVAGLCWGALIGAIIGNLILQYVLLRRTGGKYWPWRLSEDRHHPGVKKVWRLMLPIILGLALPQVSTIVGRMFAGNLGDGPVSAFMNANKLMQVPLGVFAQATAIALLPVMAAQAARMEMVALRSSVNFGIRSILFLTVPSSVFMWVLALPCVQFVYQSGQFKYADAQMTAEVLRWFAIGIFAWSAHQILTRGFYALQELKVPIIVGTIVTLIFIPLNLLLKQWLGVSGLALATSIAAGIHMAALLVLLRTRLDGLDGARLLRSVGKTVLCSLIAAVVCHLLYLPLYHRYLENVEGNARPHAGLVLLVCLTISTLVYVGMAMMLGMEETRIFRRVFRKR